MSDQREIQLQFTGANAAGTSTTCAICGQPFKLTGFDFTLSTGEPICPADAFAAAPHVHGLRCRDEVEGWMETWLRIAAPDATPRDALNANDALKELHAVKETAATSYSNFDHWDAPAHPLACEIELRFAPDRKGERATCAICGEPITMTGLDCVVSDGRPVCWGCVFHWAHEIYEAFRRAYRAHQTCNI